MTGRRDIRGEMRNLLLDRDTADRLLTGRVDPDDAPPGYALVAALLRSASTLPLVDPERERATVLAMVEEARSHLQDQPSSRDRRPIRGFARAKVVAVAVGAMLVGTTSLAVAGALPGAAQGVAQTMLATIGVRVPGPNPHATTHPSPVRPRPSVTPSPLPSVEPSPGAGHGQPGNPTARPGNHTARPGNHTARPGNHTAKPGNHTARPGNHTAKPGNHTAKPGNPTAKPGNHTASRATPRPAGQPHGNDNSSTRQRKDTIMKERNLRGVIAVALGVCLSVGLFATNAIAKPAPVTKIRFKLDDHNVPPGSPVTSDVLVRTRSNHEWVPFANALLSVRVDGTQVLTVTTDANGEAAISYAAAAGGHVMKVVFAGDATHKRAQRAQGFAVVAGATSVPSAPTLTATAGLAMVHLSWTAPADGGSTITMYNIYRSTISGSEAPAHIDPVRNGLRRLRRPERNDLLLRGERRERRRRGRDVVGGLSFSGVRRRRVGAMGRRHGRPTVRVSLAPPVGAEEER